MKDCPDCQRVEAEARKKEFRERRDTDYFFFAMTGFILYGWLCSLFIDDRSALLSAGITGGGHGIVYCYYLRSQKPKGE
jgi:hypothetical protein